MQINLTQKVVEGWETWLGMRERGGTEWGGDLDKDTVDSGEPRGGISRDGKKKKRTKQRTKQTQKTNKKPRTEVPWEVRVWVPAGPPEDWGASQISERLPVAAFPTSPPPKFHISRNSSGSDRGSRGPQSPASCWLVQACTVGDKGLGKNRGCGGSGLGLPTGPEGVFGGASWSTPAASAGRTPTLLAHRCCRPGCFTRSSCVS